MIDEAGNQRRTTIAYTSYGLPANVREYSGASVARRRETQYRLESTYVERGILGVGLGQIYADRGKLVIEFTGRH